MNPSPVPVRRNWPAVLEQFHNAVAAIEIIALRTAVLVLTLAAVVEIICKKVGW